MTAQEAKFGPLTHYGKVYALTLPSGNKVKVRRPSIFSMVRLGQLPSSLLQSVWKLFGRGQATTLDELISTDPEQMVKLIELIEVSVKAALVEPKVIDGVASQTTMDEEGFTVGQVNMVDLPDSDKNLLFGFVQGLVYGDDEEKKSADALKTFPGQPAGDGAGSGSPAVQPAAEQPATTVSG